MTSSDSGRKGGNVKPRLILGIVPPDSQTGSTGWLRLRWGGTVPLMGYLNGVTLQPITGTIKNAYIVFQEGQDTGPDNFGLAVLDNIDVNGTLVGDGHGGDHGDD